MDIGSSIRKGTSWLLMGNLGTRLIEFGVGIVLARLLLPSDFGLLVTTQIFTGVVGFIAGGGMGQALIHAKDVENKHYQVVFTLQLLICSLIYLCFYWLSPLISDWFSEPLYTDLLRISTLSFLIRPFSNVAQAKLSRAMNFKVITIINLISLIISSGLSIYFALQGFGVWGLVFSGLLGGSINVVLFLLLGRFLPVIKFDAKIAKQLGGYGFKFSINDLINYIKYQIPNFFLGTYIGTHIVGLFNKGDSLSHLPVTTISGSAYQTVFRALSALQDDLDKSKYIYLRTITLVSVYTFPFYIGLLWVAEPFIVVLYGEKWKMAAMPLQILSIGGLFRCIANPSGAVMAAQNLLGKEIVLQFMALLLTIIGCLYGVYYQDITMISIGLLPSIIFLAVTLSYYSLQILQLSYKELFIALTPAFLLNSLLANILFIGDYFLLKYMPNIDGETYLIGISLLGAIFYALLFLYFPLSKLEEEANRWKRLLYLKRDN